MKLGFIGLGRMGNRMVAKLLAEGHEVVVWNRTQGKVKELIDSKKPEWNIEGTSSIKDLVERLPKPRIIWLMLPAGSATKEILLDEGGVDKFIEKGDIIVDGGNAHYTDTQERFEYFLEKNVRFLGIGVSGGLIAAEEGYPLMVGGDKQAYEQIMPILDSLAKPGGGHEFFGEGGAGHFVKMVHNGIEYGYMQALGEGFGVLEKSPYNLDLVKVAKLYQKGTLLSGYMTDRAVEALEKDPTLEKLDGVINASGEGEWTVEEAKKNNLPIEIIKESLEFRIQSLGDKKISSSFAARMVAALRNAFGGHEVKKKSEN